MEGDINNMDVRKNREWYSWKLHGAYHFSCNYEI